MKDSETQPISVLIVEDSDVDAQLLVRTLEKGGFAVSHCVVDSASEMRQKLSEGQWDAVLSDYSLPGFSAEDALELTQESGQDIPFIVISGVIHELTAIELMRKGAHDYLMKSNLNRLVSVVRRELTEARSRKELRAKQESHKALTELVDAVFDATMNAIVAIDSKGHIIIWNSSAVNMFGYSAREALGSDVHKLIAPDEFRGAAFSGMAHFANTGEGPLVGRKFSIKAMRKNGKTFPAYLFIRPFLRFGVWHAAATISDRTKQAVLEESHKAHLAELNAALSSTIDALASTLSVRDPYTAGHQSRVSALSVAIGREMGLPEEQIEGLRLGATIHDIGKVSVPTEILNKPGRLSPIEFSLIKSHSQTGHDIIKDVKFPWPIAEMILQHHERMDGSGYPLGLKGEEIIVEARIMSVADVVEAMASHRPYRPGLGLDAALSEIETNSGKTYDPDVVTACLRLFREKDFVLPNS